MHDSKMWPHDFSLSHNVAIYHVLNPYYVTFQGIWQQKQLTVSQITVLTFSLLKGHVTRLTASGYLIGKSVFRSRKSGQLVWTYSWQIRMKVNGIYKNKLVAPVEQFGTVSNEALSWTRSWASSVQLNAILLVCWVLSALLSAVSSHLILHFTTVTTSSDTCTSQSPASPNPSYIPTVLSYLALQIMASPQSKRPCFTTVHNRR
jgi:hypothetical protein